MRDRIRTASLGAASGGAFRVEQLEARTVLSATLQGDGTLLILGSSGAESIVIEEQVTPGSVALSGVPGVAGGTVFSGVARVRVQAQQGNDSVTVLGSPTDETGTPLAFKFLGGNGNDTLRGGDADDDLRGGNGNDTIVGGAGGDYLRGGKGSDVISGESGDDTLQADNGPDVLLGGSGADTLRGGNGDDVAAGGSGADSIRGGNQADDIFGGAGADTLRGDGGRDLLRGPAGEFADFNPADAFFSEVFGTGDEGFGVLAGQFWIALDAQAGEESLASNMRTAVDALQLLKARSANERLAFEQEWLTLTEPERTAARLAFGGIVDDFVAEIQSNPGDLTDTRVLAFQLNVRDEFPEGVRALFDDYIDSMVELDEFDQLGDAMDDLEDDGLVLPYLNEFARLFVF